MCDTDLVLSQSEGSIIVTDLSYGPQKNKNSFGFFFRKRCFIRHRSASEQVRAKHKQSSPWKSTQLLTFREATASVILLCFEDASWLFPRRRP